MLEQGNLYSQLALSMMGADEEKKRQRTRCSSIIIIFSFCEGSGCNRDGMNKIQGLVYFLKRKQ